MKKNPKKLPSQLDLMKKVRKPMPPKGKAIDEKKSYQRKDKWGNKLGED